jgi:arginine decarboxylase
MKKQSANSSKGRIKVGESGYPEMHDMFVPKGIFFTNGVGVHKDRLSSFELALRDAGIEKANLVTVSSIFPPLCVEISRKEGEKLIRPGQIVHCVMARQDTNEPNRLIAASIGLARPSDPNMYGYLSEHHSYGETAKKAGEYAEDLAATMLATTLGIDFDPEKAWNEREQTFKMEKTFLKTRNIVQSAEGHAKGHWSTVVALGVFIF